MAWLLNEVDCLHVPLALAFHWKSFFEKIHSRGFSSRWTAFMFHWHWHFTDFFAKFTLMRLLNEVDCLHVLLAQAFHWKSFLTKFTHEDSHWGGLPLCAIGTDISLIYFFAKFTLMRLLNEVDCLHVPLAQAFHWKSFLTKFTHEASHSGGLPLCAIGTGISLKIFFGKT